ncbi:cadherin-related family member 3-like isoform X5 [Sciurus carolinensis]|uniref:cadherin-related family member 3-like isoform X5 n=1 Tax=Sciurus carolinensis TaxID=30640 RepID=UPI001FB21A88|nr:cadherin-related family member 3-like isoform X5 [Sciurus carolinensis]
MLWFHLFLLVAAPDVLALPKFIIENLGPLLENSSEHTRVAEITLSISPHTSLVGDPVIMNANPVVHPFVLSQRATHRWDLLTTGVPKLDFEMVMLYSLIIYAKDNQGATASQTILIQIADVNEPPTFTGSLAQGNQVTEIYILEDTAPGTIIYRTTARDPEDAALEYFISPEDSGFTIDSIGTISTASGFDFERETRSFSLVIKVVDAGGLFTTGNLKIFLINVNNKDPSLTCSLFSIENAILSVISINSTLHNKANVTLDEEIPIGKTIGACQATDEDNLGDLTFELDPQNVYFAVDKVRGTVVTATRLDVERAGFARVQSFSIKACDDDQRCAAIPVTIYIHGINDNAPFCDRYLIRYTGKEAIAKDTIVAKLSCHDLDEPPNAIRYAPSAGPVGSGQLFEQVPEAAHFIRVAQDLDYEDPEMVAAGHIYEMMISVFDDLRPSHTVTVTVIVEIAPANDFSPVFQAAHYSFSVPETSGAFHKVGRVTAMDEDHPPNCLTYKITKGDVQVIQRFWIHPLSGMIELTTQPDYESVKQYNLTVEAVDCDRVHPRTGMTTQRKGLTIVYTAINTYKSGDWYIPFIFTLMAIFLAGLVFWLCFLLWRYGNIMECCQIMTKEVFKSKPKGMKYIAAGDRNQKEKVITGSRSKKLEVLTETIVYETVFDGEAVDPVSGNVYEYNSRTGARKWKKPPRCQEETSRNTYSLQDAHPAEESTSLPIPLHG